MTFDTSTTIPDIPLTKTIIWYSNFIFLISKKCIFSFDISWPCKVFFFEKDLTSLLFCYIPTTFQSNNLANLLANGTAPTYYIFWIISQLCAQLLAPRRTSHPPYKTLNFIIELKVTLKCKKTRKTKKKQEASIITNGAQRVKFGRKQRAKPIPGTAEKKASTRLECKEMANNSPAQRCHLWQLCFLPVLLIPQCHCALSKDNFTFCFFSFCSRTWLRHVSNAYVAKKVAFYFWW